MRLFPVHLNVVRAPHSALGTLPLCMAFALTYCAVLAAQNVVDAPAALAEPAVPDNYIVGIGDLLSVAVFGSPELSTITRVSADGAIRMPYARSRIHAAGVNLEQLRAAVADSLVKENLAVDPRVEIAVKAVESKTIIVAGAVRNPTILQAAWPIRLLEALQRAGGPSESAGTHVLVELFHSDGPVTLDLPLSGVLAGVHDAYNPLLSGGEEVRVLDAGKVYVAGAVRDPGAFTPSNNQPLTVMKAIALAHGWTVTAKPRNAVLVHDGPQRSQTKLDLTQIFARKVPDPVLAGNDIIYVPDSDKKKIAFSTVDKTATSLFYALGYLLVR